MGLARPPPSLGPGRISFRQAIGPAQASAPPHCANPDAHWRLSSEDAALRFLPILLLTCLPWGQALGWGDQGHRLIAGVAEHYLTPTAKKKISNLLRGEARYGVVGCPVRTLADAATWPDCLRKFPEQYRQTFDWHYDDIPLCGRGDRAGYCPDGNCLSGRLPGFIATLGNPRAPKKDRLAALKFIAHLVGDAHQPLHAEDNGDRGGNEVPVSFLGTPGLNLHRVWDVELVQAAQGRSVDPKPLLKGIRRQDVDNWSRGGVRDWLAESHVLAKRRAYGALPQVPPCGQAPATTEVLDEAYVRAVDGTVKLRLRKAGVRLAKVLNDALG